MPNLGHWQMFRKLRKTKIEPKSSIQCLNILLRNDQRYKNKSAFWWWDTLWAVLVLKVKLMMKFFFFVAKLKKIFRESFFSFLEYKKKNLFFRPCWDLYKFSWQGFLLCRLYFSLHNHWGEKFATRTRCWSFSECAHIKHRQRASSGPVRNENCLH